MDVADLRRTLWPKSFADLRRYGRQGDGGYVLPAAAFQRADALLTFGLDFDWSFERAFAAAHAVAPIHVYDPTVGTRRFISAGFWALLGSIYSRREWSKVLACWDYFVFFRHPVRHFREWIGSGVGRVGVAAAIARMPEPRRLVLKVDIEGSEYEILEEIVSVSNRVEVLAIEFHEIAAHVHVIADFADRLNATHVVAHLHGNNYAPVCLDGSLPASIEVVFVRRSAGEMDYYTGNLPRPGLDYPNTSKRPDVVIKRP
jgi:hypothetical protein